MNRKKHTALSRPQLRMIQQRNIINEDAMTLLREIKRLQGILNNCWQVLDDVPSGQVNSPLSMLKGLINNEPCVKEQRAAYERAGKVNMGED